MYLISIYFDEKANATISRYIHHVAKESGNLFMEENQVPPHITISAFEAQDEGGVIQELEQLVSNWKQGKIQYVSVGAFLPYVLYITPVLNGYLHHMTQSIYETFSEKEGVKLSKYYRPFQWLPHTTIGKKLSKEEMQKAFEVMQKQFAVFDAMVVKIGLAKTNPHRDIWTHELEKILYK
ncbi:MAG: 2'-5' RNA ligase family protein [Lachnospiraceae bacterium]|nr:2'-5' RNA ligase family protein [Lachnospiraceae bacterium]